MTTSTLKKPTQHSLYAMAFLDTASETLLRDFFIQRCGIPAALVCRDMHVTVYHARRPMGVGDGTETIRISVPGSELRMMAMAPGGENPRDDIDPRRCSIGLRIRRADGATRALEALRRRFYGLESVRALGTRQRSDRRNSAFGARNYQPHVTVLRPGAITDPDLSKLGEALREHVPAIVFDRFVIRNRVR